MGFVARPSQNCGMKTFLLLLIFSARLEAMTLGEILDLTRERSHGIELMREESRRQAAQVKQASVLANPSLLMQAGQLSSGSARGDVVDVTLLQPLPWPGKRQAQQESAQARQALAQLEVEKSELRLQHEVTALLLRLATLKELKTHALERRARFAVLKQSLAARPQLSPVQRLEKGLIENQVRMLERGIALIEMEHDTLDGVLAQWLGRPVSLTIDWEKAPELLSLEHWQGLARTQSPAYRRQLMEKRELAAELKRSELEARPDWQLGVNYRQERLAPENNFYHAVVGLTLPLFDRGQHKSESLRAEQQLAEARFRRSTWEHDHQLITAFKLAQTQTKLMKTFGLRLIHDSEKNFREAEQEFKKGRVDALTLLATDEQIHTSIDTAFETTMDAWLAYNKLRLLAGLAPEL